MGKYISIQTVNADTATIAAAAAADCSNVGVHFYCCQMYARRQFFLQRSHARIQGGHRVQGPAPKKSKTNKEFLNNSGPDFLKSHTSIQCCAIIGSPAKRDLNSVSLAAR